jgi:signal transduction histidine kinase
LRFALHREAVAVASSQGADAPTGRLFDAAMKLVQSPVEAAELYALRSTAPLIALDFPAAAELAEHGLRLLGISLPARTSDQDIDEQLRALELRLMARGLAQLVTLPAMTDPWALAAMKLLRTFKVATFTLRPDLFPLLSIETVKLTLDKGLAADSSQAYLSHATLVAGRLGDFRRAHALGRMALQVAERTGDPATIGRAVTVFASTLLPWGESVRNAHPLQARVIEPMLAAGETLFALGALVTDAMTLFHQGVELDEVDAVLQRSLAVAGDRVLSEYESLQAYRKAIARLRGTASDDGCVEEALDARDPHPARRATGACSHLVLRLQVSYLLGDLAGAERHGAAMRDRLNTIPRAVSLVDYNLYSSLTAAARCDRAPAVERSGLLVDIAANQRQLASWAESCPENFRHKHRLIQAELARLDGRDLEAAELYEQAITGAADQQFLQDEALANELAGRFHRTGGRRGFGGLYLQRARELYRRWGARAKVVGLDREFPDLPPAGGTTGPGADLDVEALLRAVQTLSREVDEERLLGRLIEVCLVASGARRGALLLEEQGRVLVRALAGVGQPPVVLREPAETSAAVPWPLVEQVRRSGELLVRPDAVVMPIRHQGRFAAALYLENQLLGDAFSADRLRFLHLLSGQIATSLDNARLFREAREAIRLRDEFLAIVSHELNTPLASLRLTVQGLEEGRLGDSAQDQAARLQLLSRQVRRLNVLVDDLLDVAQIRTGQMRLRLEPVDLALVARETAERFSQPAARARSEIQVAADHPVPGTWDRARLEQVISNLLSNALKFAPGQPVQLSVFAAPAGATLVIEDHGPGIDPQQLPHIFERFARGVPVTGHGGLGLGLYIVREIVQALGGRITVASEAGRGTRFTVVLPDSASAPPPAAG